MPTPKNIHRRKECDVLQEVLPLAKCLTGKYETQRKDLAISSLTLIFGRSSLRHILIGRLKMKPLEPPNLYL